MAGPEAALAEAVRHIREIVLRQVMALCNRLQPYAEDYPDVDVMVFRVGHKHARMQLYDEIERMIAREAPPPPAGYYTSDGIEDGGC
jgi:hypothetical protein